MVQGQKNRAVGSHDMNEHSSRSHSILTIAVKYVQCYTVPCVLSSWPFSLIPSSLYHLLPHPSSSLPSSLYHLLPHPSSSLPCSFHRTSLTLYPLLSLSSPPLSLFLSPIPLSLFLSPIHSLTHPFSPSLTHLLTLPLLPFPLFPLYIPQGQEFKGWLNDIRQTASHRSGGIW